MGWTVTSDPVRAEEAIAWFLGKVPLSEGAFARLKDHAHRRAFMVSGLAALDIVVDVHESLGQSLSDGTTFEQWKKEIGPRIIAAWHGTVANPAHRLDTIFRTNAQSAYSTGRYHQLTDPAILKHREFWTLDTVNDDRRSPICNDLAASFEGKWLAASDPWWQDGHIPPFHFSCRTAIRSARRSVAEKDGILTSPPNVAAQQGFGATPGEDEQKALTELEQKKLERAEKVDPELVAIYKRFAEEERRREAVAGVAGSLDEWDKDRSSKSAQATVRGAVRYLVGQYGLSSFDEADGRAARNDFITEGVPQGAQAAHGWNGEITVGDEYARGAVAGFAKAAAGDGGLSHAERTGVECLIHEEIHGHSPVLGPAYVGWGRLIEEATTEVIARRIAREIIPGSEYDLPRWNGSEFTRTGKPYDRLIVSVLRSYAAVTGNSKDAAAAVEAAMLASRRGKLEKVGSPDALLQLFVDSTTLTAAEKKKLFDQVKKDYVANKALHK